MGGQLILYVKFGNADIQNRKNNQKIDYYWFLLNFIGCMIVKNLTSKCNL